MLINFIITVFAIMLPLSSFAAKWGLKNCTGITGLAYDLQLSLATGSFQNSPPILKSQQLVTFELSTSGELIYKAIDGSYLDFQFISDPYTVTYKYSWKNVWFQGIIPEACGFNSLEDSCYVALNYPDDPPQCSSPPV